MNKETVLVIAAHPDDEVLGCAGTMARLRQEGHPIHIAILGEGITSRYTKREEADWEAVKTLHARSRQAVGLLGVQDLVIRDLPDNRFDTVPLLDVVKLVETEVQRLKPEIIFTHHGGDLNIDHCIVHRAVLTATRPLVGAPVRQIYAFEVASSTEWTFQRLEPLFRPNVFIDISATIEDKIRAMEKYEGEVRAFPHPRSLEALRAIARRWGSVAGVEYAEAFELIRWVR